MRRFAVSVFAVAVLCTIVCGTTLAANVSGELVKVEDKTVTATFPVPINPRAMMMIRNGDGEAIAGAAIVQKCEGEAPPYRVTAALYFTTNAVAIAAGQKTYVNSINAGVAPSARPVAAAPAQPLRRGDGNDLGFYYYAAGQTVGYGAMGLGYEKTLRVAKGLGFELDGGVSAVGSVSDSDAGDVSADQLIKNLNGRLRLDFGSWFGVYSGYRWSQGRGDSDRWNSLLDHLDGVNVVAPSTGVEGTVQTQGIEYGMTIRPANWLSISGGYIPAFRTDFGSYGVCSEPAYTAELRFGGPSGALRLRGVRSDSYWIADLGIRIR